LQILHAEKLIAACDGIELLAEAEIVTGDIELQVERGV